MYISSQYHHNKPFFSVPKWQGLGIYLEKGTKIPVLYITRRFFGTEMAKIKYYLEKGI